MATSLKGLIQGMADYNMPQIVVGVVTSVDPVTITIRNEISINLSAQSLIIPSGKRDLLVVGTELYLLSVFSNKIYYILDRT